MRRTHRLAAPVLAALLFLPACTRQSGKLDEALRADTNGQFAKQDQQYRADLVQQSRARDCSAEFQQNFERFQAGGALDLRNYRVLVVHGLLGEVGLKFTHFLDKFDDTQRLVDYLKDQQRTLERDGADTVMLGYKSDSVERCGSEVAQRIRASDRPVLIISHSKGCLDTLEALLDLQAENNLSNVAGWVAIQGPFAGAPDVDAMQDNKFYRIKTRVAIKCLGARFDAVNDMKTSTRKEYLETHCEAIDRLVARVPVVSFASWVENAKKPGTDGAVPVSSAVLPATDFALVRGLSHSATVINRGGDFDRVAFTRALMTMLLDRVAKAKAPAAAVTKN